MSIQKISKTKLLSTFAIFIMLASIAMIANVSAQEESHGGEPGPAVWGPLPSGVTPDVTVDTMAYMSITPNPIGLNQQVLVNIWLTPGTQRARYGVGYTVDIIKPDGTNDTVGPMQSYFGDNTAWFTYTMNQVGTWRFKFHQAGVYYPAGQYNDSGWPSTFGSGFTIYTYSMYYTPSSTEWQNLTVQENMVSAWPGAPLPTDYWTRPVNPQFR